jgi:catecholate siderophore receptor
MSVSFKANPFGVTAQRRPSGALVAASLGLAMSSSLAAAADAPPLEGVTVTARGDAGMNNVLTKLPSALKDIPQSVTVLDRALLQSQGAASLTDALRNVPGITLGGAEGGQIGNNINLNGFSARTDVYMDGFRDRGQYYRDIFALENVEVLMGPSSMLFGRGSTGGVINQAPKKASLMAASEFAVSATSNGLARGTADLNAPLSDKAAVRISAMGQQGAVSTRRQTSVKDYGLAPTAAWGIGAPTQLTLSGLLQHNNDRPDYGQPPLNLRPAQVGADTVYGYSDDRTIQDIRAVSGEIRHSFAPGLTLRDQLQYNSVDTDARETAPQGIGTVGPAGYVALSPAGVSGLPPSSLFVQMQSHDRVIHDTSLFNQAELHADVSVGGLKQALLAGLEFGHDSYANQGLSRTGACNGVALRAGFTSCTTLLNPSYPTSPTAAVTNGNRAGGEADTAAAYFTDTLALTPQIKLTGGVRYDRYAATITNSINSANTTGSTAFPSLSQTVGYTSVRGGAIWQPTPAQSYYLSYSTSFNPSLEQLTSTTGISQPLPPESNRAYEAGAKFDALKGRLNLTAAAFQIVKYNARSQNADNTYSATGTVRVEGFRLGAAGHPARGWQVYGGYTRLGATIVNAIAAGTQGGTPLNTPRDSATLWTTYEIGHNLQIGGGAAYMSERYLTNLDTVKVPAYTRIDATLAWRRPHYDLRLNLFNLLDAKYYDSLIPSDGGRAVPGSGRTAMISLVYRP